MRGELLSQAETIATAEGRRNEALGRQVAALEEGGTVAVREALFRSLAKTDIRIVPLTRETGGPANAGRAGGSSR